MHTTNRFSILYVFSGILIVLSALLHFFGIGVSVYTMMCGVLGFTVATWMNRYRGENVRAKRLYLFQVMGCILMGVSAYWMYLQRNEWIVFMLIASVFLLYSAFFLPKELDKDS